MTSPRILSVHKTRRAARRVEREVQTALDLGARFVSAPGFAGARVEKAGRRQWAVVLTETRGR